MANNLKTVRLSHNLSQLEVAKRAFVSQSAYCRYESGKRNIPIDVLVRLADLFQTSIDSLIVR